MNKYTSLELSKKLKENGCELESENYISLLNGGIITSEEKYDFDDDSNSIGLPEDSEIEKFIQAYDILNDICCRYKKKFFGEEKIYERHGDSKYEAWFIHTECLFELVQLDTKQEAEEYIWEHCLFNPKNK